MNWRRAIAFSLCRRLSMLLARGLICALLSSCAAPPESSELSNPRATDVKFQKEQQQPDRLIVHYADGAEVVVEDWEFRYTFGSQDTKPQAFTWYAVNSKTSRDLHLQKEITERSITSKREVVIRGDQLSKIRFDWWKMADLEPTAGEPQHEEVGSLSQIIIITKDGVSQTYEPAEFDVSDAFLSLERFVFEKRLSLLGRVRQGDGFSEFDLSIGFGMSPPSKKEQVEEIRF